MPAHPSSEKLSSMPVITYTNDQLDQFIKYLQDDKENIPSIRIVGVDGSERVISTAEPDNFELLKDQLKNAPRLVSSIIDSNGFDITYILTKKPTNSLKDPQKINISRGEAR